MTIAEFKPKEPKSKEAIVEILRGVLDTAFEEKITYLNIDMKVDGQIRSVSISTHDEV